MYKILVADDEANIRNVIKEYAQFNGHSVKEAKDGMDAVSLCKQESFDLVIMDIMMPRLDGFSACKEIKKTSDTPVIMLSARNEEYDKLFGFELGIDDYMTKPFSPKELMARINAVMQRNNRSIPVVHEVLTFGGLVIDKTAHTVVIDGVKTELPPKEYDLLIFLADNKNIALPREKLLTNVWGYDFCGDDRTIDTHIKTLRNNLGKYRDSIVTLRGVGYRFEARSK